ncbi:DUF5107 domain-containing protein [Sinomicrobium soli]|uniref:DUF5107 domain-containing protein n=1 Tax=Sinomicrobium sp. N-1-3-6 TaxID=2219864 RepID=UPI000DCDD9D1|nr:DUF5107 domain-containing protein [Sinomicrobium sp. N-1-3-6]RAV30011.1 DUF5107 domain-containing protein [Sinomicrobium sp. N-1-3-6]
MKTVKVWKEKRVIPTYEVGEPEKYPIFLEKRVYQGSSGAVYPNAVIEKIADEKTDKEWEVIFLENDFLKIMILPALGGRIQMAYDKLKERHFVYYNHVIKPALVGLTGPWISGGIEFNWPQHHRPSTYDAVDFSIEENEDGSKTVWVSEVERMFRTKGMAGFTLYPDKAYLEIRGQVYNRTPHPQTFLWWANPAVAVNDEYQSVFPPDVNAVFDHGKRDVSEFPIATGTYYKVDYSAGVDISKYKNIPVPTSYMAITSDYDFVGGYENDTRAGLLHVADHHVSPGKKQWTWGNGDFGHAWDRNLTDTDGPYIELMCGVYTDNQPDFTWLQPYEEKTFRQYFMPYQTVGMVKNATRDALVNLELHGKRVMLKVYVTGAYPASRITLRKASRGLFSETVDLQPGPGYEVEFDIEPSELHELTVTVENNAGKKLVSWTPEKPGKREVPEPARAAKAPSEIAHNEQLFLRGLHLEQYRHATYDPTSYYKEALRRDKGDVRCNNAMGLWLLRRGKSEEAITYFERAIETLTERNPNPYDGEPYFNLGVACRFTGDTDRAYGAFYKACWNDAWQHAGYFNLAQIDAARQDFENALELVEKSLVKNAHNHKARHLKVMLLRKLGRREKAAAFIEESLGIDRFNFGALYEKYLLENSLAVKKQFEELIRDNPHNYIEYSLDYAQAGFYEEAAGLLSLHIGDKEQVYPMVCYFTGWYKALSGRDTEALEWYKKASLMSPDYCFPNRPEEAVALQAALAANPEDSRAGYYLGNFWYAGRQYEDALECWERSRALDGDFPLVLRNLALICYNKAGRPEDAVTYLESAFELDKNARVLMELDQLYKKINRPVEERLQFLETNLELVDTRDDLYLERISLYNITGAHEKALELLASRKFHPWEGGEGKITGQYVTAHVERAKILLYRQKGREALEHLQAARSYPHNLGEGKLQGAQENDIHYWEGCAYEVLGDRDKARKSWEKATRGSSEPLPAFYYNDQQPDMIFYQGIAFLKLGNSGEAGQRFQKLIEYGEQHTGDQVKIDYFAVSLPDLLIWEEDLNVRNQIHCHYLIGLGKLGLGEYSRATEEFVRVLEKDRYHLGGLLHKKLVENNGLLGIPSVAIPD